MSNYSPEEMAQPHQIEAMQAAQQPNIWVDALKNGALSALGGLPGALTSGLLNSGFGLLTGAVGSLIQTNQQKKLMRYQLDLEKQMFDYTSEYNSMKNQVQRYKDAGLNPNLLTGQSQQAGTTGSISAGNAAMPLFQSQLQYAQHSQLAASLQNTAADTKLKESQVDLNTFLAIKEMFEGLQGKEKARVAGKMADLSVDMMETEILDKSSHAQLNSELARTEICRQYNIDKQSALYIAQALTEEKRPELIASEISKNKSETEYKKALAAVTAYQINVMVAQIGEHNAKSHLAMSQHVWQALRNGDYERFTNAELAKISSEVYQNYFSRIYTDKIGVRQINWEESLNPQGSLW